MGELMRPIEIDQLVNWSNKELETYGSIFGVRKGKFYKNSSNNGMTIFGTKLGSPIGPAAGPNSQLAQNIVASYLAGSRFIELKTVQIMDGEELRKCISRPCINATDECYNVEWSTEFTVPEAFDEYVKAWFMLHVLGKEHGLSNECDFAFNMSVGYSLEGIQSEKIDKYIEGMKDASNTEIWKKCYNYLAEHISEFKKFTKEDLDKISSTVSSSITLSTLHGCPKEEIEKIADYLLKVKGTNTYIKCNPTLLGYEFARKTLDAMGYDYISFDDHHFKNDLQFSDAVDMLKRLQATAKEKNLGFGVKITNTFPVQIKRGELPGEEMYMSGRSLFPLSVSAANNISKAFNGELPISYSGGADYFNLESLIETGIRPITLATTILKPGGYERLTQLAELAEKCIDAGQSKIDVEKLKNLAENITKNKMHNKAFRPVGSRKTKSNLDLFDCAKAPCKFGGCPIEQQIPAYLMKLGKGENQKGFEIIAIDNTAPSITGTICDHQCQYKCTRLDYDNSLEIRNAKKILSDSEQAKFTSAISAPATKTDKKVAVVGAGPAGIAAAVFLRRNGVEVTVFEKSDKPYGIVAHVIPEFRITQEDIKKDYDMAVKWGVNFKFNCDENYCIDELKKEYEFVVLATGAWQKGQSPVKTGEEKIIDALEFLQKSKASNLKLELGKTVAVIGGGDVAMDCARAAKRNNGVEKAVIVYRRTKEFMPAQHEEIELAVEDGVEFMELLAPESYDGKVLKCEVMKLGDIDASGRRGVVGTGEIKELAFDTVVGAVGARVDKALFEKNGVAFGERGAAKVNDANETSVANVYIAGDCKAGAATIVKGIADSKAIAKDILKKLALTDDFVQYAAEPGEVELETIYAKKGILKEASCDEKDTERCLSCGKICEICCDVCPNRANMMIEVTGDKFAQAHQILHVDGMCNECGNCGIFCPHAGNPYKDKITIFWTEHDFEDSENRGFLQVSSEKFKVRLEDGKVVDYTVGDGSIPEKFEQVIAVVLKDYAYVCKAKDC